MVVLMIYREARGGFDPAVRHAARGLAPAPSPRFEYLDFPHLGQLTHRATQHRESRPI